MTRPWKSASGLATGRRRGSASQALAERGLKEPGFWKGRCRDTTSTVCHPPWKTFDLCRWRFSVNCALQPGQQRRGPFPGQILTKTTCSQGTGNRCLLSPDSGKGSSSCSCPTQKMTASEFLLSALRWGPQIGIFPGFPSLKPPFRPRRTAPDRDRLVLLFPPHTDSSKC